VPEAGAVPPDVLQVPLLPGVAEQRDAIHPEAPDVAGLPLAHQPNRGAVQRGGLPLRGRLPVVRRGEANRPVGSVAGPEELEERLRDHAVDGAADEGLRVRLARRPGRADVRVGDAPAQVLHLRGRGGEVHRGAIGALPFRGDGADRSGSGRDGTVAGLEHVDEVRAARDVLRLRLHVAVVVRRDAECYAADQEKGDRELGLDSSLEAEGGRFK
jgi:hypothetical protein